MNEDKYHQKLDEADKVMAMTNFKKYYPEGVSKTIEKIVVKEVPIEVEKIVEKTVEKEVFVDNPEHLKTIEDLKKQIVSFEKANAKLKKLISEFTEQ